MPRRAARFASMLESSVRDSNRVVGVGRRFTLRELAEIVILDLGPRAAVVSLCLLPYDRTRHGHVSAAGKRRCRGLASAHPRRSRRLRALRGGSVGRPWSVHPAADRSRSGSTSDDPYSTRRLGSGSNATFNAASESRVFWSPRRSESAVRGSLVDPPLKRPRTSRAELRAHAGASLFWVMACSRMSVALRRRRRQLGGDDPDPMIIRRHGRGAQKGIARGTDAAVSQQGPRGGDEGADKLATNPTGLSAAASRARAPSRPRRKAGATVLAIATHTRGSPGSA